MQCVWRHAQAQCILFRRYPDVLEPFKYGGYPLLLAAVTLPDDRDAPADGKKGPAHFLSPEQAPLLQVPPLYASLNAVTAAEGFCTCRCATVGKSPFRTSMQSPGT